uniref:Uncharacterized protein n=1 Tax=Romanomermis culicivorax TaxID=13658 RepID=A0A915IJC6_ROMCU
MCFQSPLMPEILLKKLADASSLERTRCPSTLSCRLQLQCTHQCTLQPKYKDEGSFACPGCHRCTCSASGVGAPVEGRSEKWRERRENLQRDAATVSRFLCLFATSPPSSLFIIFLLLFLASPVVTQYQLDQ